MRKTIKNIKGIPRLYGLAYYDALSNKIVCYPIPLNIIIRIVMSLWLRLKKPKAEWWEIKESKIRSKIVTKCQKKIINLEMENASLKNQVSLLNLTLSSISEKLYSDSDSLN